MSVTSHPISVEHTKKIAQNLALRLVRGDVVTLAGDLGAGKTTFAQFLIQALSTAPVEVTSPTFTLLQTYPVALHSGDACELYHYDLYRIEHPSQLTELGMEDALQGITIMEWPERLEGVKMPVTLAISFTLDETGGHSIATIMGDARFDGWMR
jgi:tRNA threonylcarbamoyl adenosine modification protein YjeE